MQLKKGFLVAFEGIDGAGKTTQAHLLHKKLKRKEYDVILSKEPTDSIYGLRIKKLAQSERAITKPIDEYELFLNDRKIHVKDKIKPSLEQKKIVILDRYYFSTIAYQGALGLNPKKIKDDNESFAPIPEIVFLIDVPPRVGLRRVQKGRNEVPNLFEREENLIKVREVFESMKEHYIARINGLERIEKIHAIIMNVVEPILDHYVKKTEQYALFNANRPIETNA